MSSRMHFSRLAVTWVVGACFTVVGSGWARDISYAIDDGTSELGLGIDPGEDSLWFTQFPVQTGGEIITSIHVAFGRPGGVSSLNGLAVTVLLYEDTDGGSPWNAVLRTSAAGVVANGNTNTFNVFPINPTEVHGSFLAAVLFRNRTAVNQFIGAVDRTAPHVTNASFYGYTVGDMNEADLSSIPTGQFGTLESIVAGNFLLRATGVPIPEPSGSLAVMAFAGTVTWCRRPRRHG